MKSCHILENNNLSHFCGFESPCNLSGVVAQPGFRADYLKVSTFLRLPYRNRFKPGTSTWEAACAKQGQPPYTNNVMSSALK